MTAKFSLRIVDADYYLEKPVPSLDICFSECRNRDVAKVPVVRIFGSTPQGQKCCLHVHRIFPYFYILIPEDEIFPLEFGKKFVSSLDMAIHMALGKALSKQQDYVYSYEIVMKRPLYGYYEDEKKFLKVLIFNPGLMTKISELLVSGAVMNQFFQPYETHIPYLLQFFIDYNLHGMNMINLNAAMFRTPVPQGSNFNMSIRSPTSESSSFSQTNYNVFNSDTIPGSLLLPIDILKKSTCSLECDTLECNIMNRQLIKEGDMNPGLKAIWDDERQRRLDNNESSNIELQCSQERDRFKITTEEKFQLERLSCLLKERMEKLASQQNTGDHQSKSDQKNVSECEIEESFQNVHDCSGSSDQTLVNILVGLAEDNDDAENSNSFTPLSDTTLMNNGLDEENDVNEDDEKNDCITMSQTLHGEEIDQHLVEEGNLEQAREINDGADNIIDCSWSDSFLWKVPQYDGGSTMCFSNIDESCDNKSVMNDAQSTQTVSFKTKSTICNCSQDKIKTNRAKIPQLDGKDDLNCSNSSDDFKPVKGVNIRRKSQLPPVLKLKQNKHHKKNVKHEPNPKKEGTQCPKSWSVTRPESSHLITSAAIERKPIASDIPSSTAALVNSTKNTFQQTSEIPVDLTTELKTPEQTTEKQTLNSLLFPVSSPKSSNNAVNALKTTSLVKECAELCQKVKKRKNPMGNMNKSYPKRMRTETKLFECTNTKCRCDTLSPPRTKNEGYGKETVVKEKKVEIQSACGNEGTTSRLISSPFKARTKTSSLNFFPDDDDPFSFHENDSQIFQPNNDFKKKGKKKKTQKTKEKLSFYGYSPNKLSSSLEAPQSDSSSLSYSSLIDLTQHDYQSINCSDSYSVLPNSKESCKLKPQSREVKVVLLDVAKSTKYEQLIKCLTSRNINKSPKKEKPGKSTGDVYTTSQTSISDIHKTQENTTDLVSSSNAKDTQPNSGIRFPCTDDIDISDTTITKSLLNSFGDALYNISYPSPPTCFSSIKLEDIGNQNKPDCLEMLSLGSPCPSTVSEEYDVVQQILAKDDFVIAESPQNEVNEFDEARTNDEFFLPHIDTYALSFTDTKHGSIEEASIFQTPVLDNDENNIKKAIIDLTNNVNQLNASHTPSKQIKKNTPCATSNHTEGKSSFLYDGDILSSSCHDDDEKEESHSIVSRDKDITKLRYGNKVMKYQNSEEVIEISEADSTIAVIELSNVSRQPIPDEVCVRNKHVSKSLFRIEFQRSESDLFDAGIEQKECVDNESPLLDMPDMSNEDGTKDCSQVIISPQMYGQDSFFYDSNNQNFSQLHQLTHTGGGREEETHIIDADDAVSSTTSIENCDIKSGVMQLSDTDEDDLMSPPVTSQRNIINKEKSNMNSSEGQEVCELSEIHPSEDDTSLLKPSAAISSKLESVEKSKPITSNMLERKFCEELVSTPSTPSTPSTSQDKNHASQESGEENISMFHHTSQVDMTTEPSAICDLKKIVIAPKEPPPTRQQILESLSTYNLTEKSYQQAFFGNEKDENDIISVFRGRHGTQCRSKTNRLVAFDSELASNGALECKQKEEINKLEISDIGNLSKTYHMLLRGNDIVVMTPCKQPPSRLSVSKWLQLKNQVYMEKPILQTRDIENKTDLKQTNSKQTNSVTPACFMDNSQTPKISFGIDRILNISDIEGVSLNNTYGFNHTHNDFQDAKSLHVNQYLTAISIEVHSQTRREMNPDPSMDSIIAIFFTMCKDVSKSDHKNSDQSGVFIFDRDLKSISGNDGGASQLLSKTGFDVSFQRCYDNEKDMLINFASFIQEIDPDFLIGYEVQMLSWGYVIERGATLDLNMCQILSRIMQKEDTHAQQKNDKPENWYGQLINMQISGRIILNVWRVMRSEVTLQVYSYENVSYHVLHRRVPAFTYRCLSDWWTSNFERWKVCQHYMIRCEGNLKLLEQIDFINRTSELARVFGILFYTVISRGTQYRVESMMLRTAKPLNYIPVSPSVQQRSKMAAPECISLVMEPESRFYVDPVIVLDFQSLYPSIIIAYNYCYSTCLGKVQSFALNETYKFGATSLNIPTTILEKLSRRNIHISPNGVGFVTTDVKTGVLPRMLEEILSTRIMVKNSMKTCKDNKVLHRMLDSRQLGLKLISNVTYGYTSANYSGRMPCIEIGDSVVRKGRETLERAIHLVNATQKWNAKVVYGDTDSLFVLVKGASKERSFQIAQEIVDEVTALNPKPVKLKFEKVYQPCCLITKKRYVGYSYESLDQKEPTFDAKGIETVRRDNCPVVGKMLEKSIRTLFETKNVSTVKSYVQHQLLKILQGRSTMKEFIIAKEYRGMSSYRPGACVPALLLARKRLKRDRRSEPRTGQRVPYVIINGSPGLPLIQLVRAPHEVIENPGLRINETYYITKQILPALSRIFSLIGVNVDKWFTDLPKMTRVQDRDCNITDGQKKGTISQYFVSQHCIVCEQLTTTRLCAICRQDTQHTVVALSSRLFNIERRQDNLMKLCQHCAVTWQQDTQCVSLDCPVFYKLSNNSRDMKSSDILRSLLQEMEFS